MTKSKKKEEEEIELDTAPVKVEFQDPLVEYRSKRFNSIEPLRKNGCTDIPCFMIFIVAITMWSYIGIYAMLKGDDNRILTPFDSHGRRCGADSNVLDVPHQFIHDLSQCVNLHNIVIGCTSKSTCVKKCPDGTFDYDKEGCNEGKLRELKPKLLCDKFVNVDAINSCADVKKFMEEDRCAKAYVPTESFSQICLPTNKEDIEATLNRTLIANSFRLPILSGVKEITIEAIEQIKAEWQEILGCLAASLIICLTFIFLLRWFAGPIIYVSIFGLLSVLLAGSVFSFIRYGYLKNNPVTEKHALTNVLAYFKRLIDNADTWVWIGSILAVIFIVILLIILCIYSRIRLAIQIIREGSRAVNSSIVSMFFPILPLLLQCLTTTFVIYVYLNLNTLSDSMYKIKGMKEHGDTCVCYDGIAFNDGDACDPEEFNRNCTEKFTKGSCENVRCALEEEDSWEITSYKITSVVGGIWLVFFISAFNEMVLASVYSRWYWTYKKSKVPFCALCSAVVRCIRYHLGTIAFGSLIITICRLLRLMVEYIKMQCDKYPNKFTKAILWVFRCVFWCLEKFMKFVNKNAYIMCAIHGTNFCVSARDAFTLLLQNGLRLAALHTVTGYLFFMSKLLISIGVATLVFIYVHKYEIIFPSILVGLVTYVIADLFFGVYSMANSTMFLCALEDASKNDGSVEHPYFMSKRLSKILVDSKSDRKSKKDDD